MNLVTPDSGLLFWMVLIFGIVLFILAKWGFPAITSMVEKRSERIDKSLALAREAEQRMQDLAKEQAELVAQTKKEQDRILKEAVETRNQIIAKAHEDASLQAISMLETVQTQIAAEKENALRELRKEVADLSIDIAEKVVRRELSSDKAQLDYIDSLVNELEHADKTEA